MRGHKHCMRLPVLNVILRIPPFKSRAEWLKIRLFRNISSMHGGADRRICRERSERFLRTAPADGIRIFPGRIFQGGKIRRHMPNRHKKNAPGKFPFRARYLTNQLMRPFARFAALAAGASGVMKKFGISQICAGKRRQAVPICIQIPRIFVRGVTEDIACALRNASILISPNVHKE